MLLTCKNVLEWYLIVTKIRHCYSSFYYIIDTV